MRVLHLIKTADGAAWGFRQIAVLRAHGAEVAVCLPEGKMADKYRAEGVKVYPFTFSINPVRIMSGMVAFRKVIKDFRPDIVHSHFIITTLFARLYRFFFSLKVPLVFQVPGPLHMEHSFFRNADLRSSNKNDYWIGSCNWTSKKYVSCGIPENRVFKSLYGTDTTYVKQHEPGKLRKELGLSKDDFIVAIVAFMYKPKAYIGQKNGIKGHEDFFLGVAEAMKKNNKIKAVVVGGAWDGATDYEEKLVSMGKELCGENIYFMGSRSDVPELYADIDLVVHPSYSENLGGAAESLMLAVPTIATNIGGFPDIVIEGETGYLVNVAAPHEIAEKILHVAAHYEEAKKLAMNGRELLLRVMDVRKTGKEVFDIYNTILSNRPGYVQVFQKAV
jgi:glycosyltransferase involved in cell wall biosynthesis